MKLQKINHHETFTTKNKYKSSDLEFTKVLEHTKIPSKMATFMNEQGFLDYAYHEMQKLQDPMTIKEIV